MMQYERTVLFSVAGWVNTETVSRDVLRPNGGHTVKPVMAGHMGDFLSLADFPQETPSVNDFSKRFTAQFLKLSPVFLPSLSIGPTPAIVCNLIKSISVCAALYQLSHEYLED